LKYAYYDGSWHIETVDSTGDVGMWSSIALDTNNNPHISYHDSTNLDLKYAYYDGSWNIQIVDNYGDVGYVSSIALDTSDNPHISYRHGGQRVLKYAYYDGSWHTETVDNSDNCGWYASVALDTNNNPHISYINSTVYDLKYATTAAGNIPPTIVYVDDDNIVGPWDGTQDHPYQYIQDGIDAVAENGTVQVYNGTYYENVEVDKPITLIGEDKDTTIVDGTGSGDVFYITADQVNLSGFTFKNGSWGAQVQSYNNSIYNNNIIDNYYGIWTAYLAYNNTIKFNRISNNTFGIWIDASYNTISDNIISHNLGYGLVLIGGEYNKVLRNNVTFNNKTGYEPMGILIDYSDNNTIKDNNISNNFYGMEIIYGSSFNQISGNTITANEFWGLYLFDDTNGNVIFNNYFNNSNNVNNPYNYLDGNNIWNITKTEGTNIMGGPYLGGNYWSNYTGIDTDVPPDGIGDTQEK